MTADALDKFIEIVADHYANKEAAAPLLLSRFGQLHGALLGQLKASYGTLSGAASAAGADRVRIVGAKKGQEAVTPAHLAEEVDRKLRETADRANVNSSKFDSLPASAKIAFCLRTTAGEKVALQIQPPFKYERLPHGGILRPGFRVVDDAHRKPGLLLKSASTADRDALWGEFLAWCAEEGVDPAVFTALKHTTALSRLLAAQEPDVLSRLNIPADIVDLLLKRP